MATEKLIEKYDLFTEAEADLVARYQEAFGLKEAEAAERVKSERVGPAATPTPEAPVLLPANIDEATITAIVTQRVTALLPELLNEQLRKIRSQDQPSGIADTAAPTGSTEKVHGQPDPVRPTPDPEPEPEKGKK